GRRGRWCSSDTATASPPAPASPTPAWTPRRSSGAPTSRRASRATNTASPTAASPTGVRCRCASSCAPCSGPARSLAHDQDAARVARLLIHAQAAEVDAARHRRAALVPEVPGDVTPPRTDDAEVDRLDPPAAQVVQVQLHARRLGGG